MKADWKMTCIVKGIEVALGIVSNLPRIVNIGSWCQKIWFSASEAEALSNTKGCQENLTKRNLTKKQFFGQLRSTNLYENPFIEQSRR